MICGYQQREGEEGRAVSRQNIGTLHLAPTQFLNLPGSHRKTWFQSVNGMFKLFAIAKNCN